MRNLIVSVSLAVALGFFMAPAMGNNDQCVMCHQDQAENPVAAHNMCSACHSNGAEAHLANFQEHPEPVTDETCTTCHQTSSEKFTAVSAHGAAVEMGMECSQCHAIHEKSD